MGSRTIDVLPIKPEGGLRGLLANKGYQDQSATKNSSNAMSYAKQQIRQPGYTG